MSTEFLVSLIIGVLGFIFKSVREEQERRYNATQELRKSLQEDDMAAVSGSLDDQHTRVQQALYSSGFKSDGKPL